MEVKEDFYIYRSGVYRHSLPADYLPPHQRQTSFHSVRLIGSVLLSRRYIRPPNWVKSCIRGR